MLLLGLIGWLGGDAIVAGDGRTPWLALATLILLVPLVLAFTLRPAVFAGDDRMRVRNPFRVIVLPWGQVASLRSAYSNEVVAESGRKFQLWSIPVSLRARKKAARQQDRAAADQAAEREGKPRRRRGGFGGPAGFGGGLSSHVGPDVPEGPARAEGDKAMDELRKPVGGAAEGGDRAGRGDRAVGVGDHRAGRRGRLAAGHPGGRGLTRSGAGTPARGARRRT
ncbi:hypothetical protein RKD18_005185 [Streptomyces phaeoluteigriseus]